MSRHPPIYYDILQCMDLIKFYTSDVFPQQLPKRSFKTKHVMFALGVGQNIDMVIYLCLSPCNTKINTLVPNIDILINTIRSSK